MRIAANKAYCRICRNALLTRKSLIPMRTSAKSVPRKKRTSATSANPLFLHDDSYLIFKFENPSSKIVGGPVGGEIEGCTTCGSEGSTQGYGKIGTWKITDHYESPMFWAEIKNSYTGCGS